MKGSTHAHPYAVPRPRAPPLEAALGREAVDDEGAAPRGAVRLVVDEALLGGNLGCPEVDGAVNREACEVSMLMSPASHQSDISQSPVISQSSVSTHRQ